MQETNITRDALRVDWTEGDGYKMKCKRCGIIEERFPELSIEEHVAAIFEFNEQHKNCKLQEQA